MIETGQSPYFANAITYEELYSIVEESKDIINSWTFNNQNDLLNKAIHPFNLIFLNDFTSIKLMDNHNSYL